MARTPLTPEQLLELNQEIGAADRSGWRDSGFDFSIEKLLGRYEFSLARSEARLQRASWLLSQLQRTAPTREVAEAIRDWIAGA